MKYLPLLAAAIPFFFQGCVPVTPATTDPGKSIIYDDVDYESLVALVQVYPVNENTQASLSYPVISLNDPGIYLSFDLMEENATYLNARLVHCNANWEPSILTDIQYLNVYNEFTINQYNYSANTRIPYVHYYTTLPTPAVSGNYLVVVYRNNDKEDLIFTRRFSVFQQKTTIDSEITQSSIVAKRIQNQQVRFAVSYEGLGNVNPLREIKAVLLQNHNWNMALTDLKPTLMRPDQNFLEYHHFNGENNFPGGNEFRYFDLRSIDYRGMNVSNIRKEEDKVQAFLGQDKPRADLAYSQLNQDLNGRYYLQNTDPNDSELQSEYVEVFFSLLSERLDGKVYIFGQFNNWALNAANQMRFDPETQSYRGKLWLRQGYYDYAYWIQSDTRPGYAIEGSFYQTENNYEILIYYRDPFKNYDELIGYQLTSSGN